MQRVSIVTLVTLITLALLVALVLVPPAASAAPDDATGTEPARVDEEESPLAGAAAASDPFETSGANVMLEILDDFERFWIGVTPREERRLDGVATALGAAASSESDDPVAVVVGRGAGVVVRILDAMLARATREATSAEDTREAEGSLEAMNASEASAMIESLKESFSRLSPAEIAEKRQSTLHQLELLSDVKARLAEGGEVDGSASAEFRDSFPVVEAILTLDDLLTRSPPGMTRGGAVTAEEIASRVETLAPVIESLFSEGSPPGAILVGPVAEALGALLPTEALAGGAGEPPPPPDARPSKTDLRIARALRSVRQSVTELEKRLARLEAALESTPANEKTTEGDR